MLKKIRQSPKQNILKGVVFIFRQLQLICKFINMALQNTYFFFTIIDFMIITFHVIFLRSKTINVKRFLVCRSRLNVNKGYLNQYLATAFSQSGD